MPDGSPPGLAELNLRPGDRVRFRRATGVRWQEATVVGRERDGSIAARDAKGASRSLVAERLEVLTTGSRGRPNWEPVLSHATRTEQMRLL